MPAAAVIPAPIAYIKVVAVKKLVVGFWSMSDCPPHWCVRFDGFFLREARGPSLVCRVESGLLL